MSEDTKSKKIEQPVYLDWRDENARPGLQCAPGTREQQAEHYVLLCCMGDRTTEDWDTEHPWQTVADIRAALPARWQHLDVAAVLERAVYWGDVDEDSTLDDTPIFQLAWDRGFVSSVLGLDQGWDERTGVLP